MWTPFPIRVVAAMTVALSLLVAPSASQAETVPINPATHEAPADDYKGWGYLRSPAAAPMTIWKWSADGWKQATANPGAAVWIYPWGGGWTWIWTASAWHATRTGDLATWTCNPVAVPVDLAPTDSAAGVVVYRTGASIAEISTTATSTDLIRLQCANGFADATATGATYALVKVTRPAADATFVGYARTRDLSIAGTEPEPPAADLKQPVVGLVASDAVPTQDISDRFPSVDNVVLRLPWSQFETADQKFDGPAWKVVDDALADPRNLRIRLSITAGAGAPNFVKRLGHASVSGAGIDCAASGGLAIYRKSDDRWTCTAFFWTAAYLTEYEELMREVATRYETNPRLAEIVNSACTTNSAEPFTRALDDLGSNKRLFDAGLNYTTDLACQERANLLHRALFRTTRTSLAIGPWDIVDGSPDDGRRPTADSWLPVRDLLNQWKQQTGPRLVLQYNQLGKSDACPAWIFDWTDHHLCYLILVSQPKGFQTVSWARLGGTPEGLYAALDRAIAMDACYVEIPTGFQAADPDTLASYDLGLSPRC